MNWDKFLLIALRIVLLPLTMWTFSMTLNLANQKDSFILALISLIVFIVGILFTLEFWKTDYVFKKNKKEIEDLN